MTTRTGGMVPGAEQGGHRHVWDEPAPGDRLLACPTCLVLKDGAGDRRGSEALLGAGAPDVTPQACPTCGFVSVEWGLGMLIDRTLVELLGLERLDAAIAAMA
ncbi:MAG TPA: hypothetical protein VES01_06420 [Dermatophilaceae bacterium]|nr:hypothetical protein [Dermatophilaceae bacterium]